LCHRLQLSVSEAARRVFLSVDLIGQEGLAGTIDVQKIDNMQSNGFHRMKRLAIAILCEPLLHFLVAGSALFIAGHVYENTASVYRIVLTPQHIAQLANRYALQFGTRPNPPTLDALVRGDIDDEILFREGLALKLDRGDEIVRRRVVQKMQFLMQDLNTPSEPANAQLRAYYSTHASRYVAPPRVTFSHIYFSTDRDGNASARGRATAVLSKLSNTTTRAPDRGDPFPDLYDFSAYEPEQVFRLFGHTPFADAVFAASPGHWSGPFRSGYGWHLLYVDARQSSTRPALSAVRDAVRTDYLQDAQNKANKAAFDGLAQRFTVIRGTPAP
jgi:peptidyl-prolyl cis-trans isomerase C